MPPISFPQLLAALVVGGLLLFLPRLLPRVARSARVFIALLRTRAERDTDLTRAAAYHRALPAADRADALDDRTWDDLDLDQVFLSLDHTRSEPGRQYLYHLLRTPTADRARLLRLERVIGSLGGDGAVAPARAALDRLGDPRAGHLVDLLFGGLPRRPRLWWLFPLLTIGSVVLLGLFVSGAWPAAGAYWLALCFANILLQLAYRPRVKQFIPALHQLPAFLDVATTLGALPVDELAPERRVLRDGAAALRTLRRATWWLQFEPGHTSELAASIYEYANLAFLLDVNAFVLAIDTIRARRDVMRHMFEAVGYVDAAQSIAAWRDTLPRWTAPEFTDARKALHVEGLVHPLVSRAVPNALALDGTGALITGSNMSGKSTFVRAVGLGAVLAQTLHTVCAEAWRGPPLRVRTSVGRADSVMEGKSYYLAEAEAVLALVRASESGMQHLFLLDEIFRGTNTTERVAAGYAVLAYLDRGPNLVVVATHDLELLDLLGDRYEALHFREQVMDGTLSFDYRIHAGPSSTRNAIALLEMLRYPDALVADALAAVDWQHRRAELRDGIPVAGDG